MVARRYFEAVGQEKLSIVLLEGEIRSEFAINVVQQKKFSGLPSNGITRYQNRSIETAQVVEELWDMAKKFSEAAS